MRKILVVPIGELEQDILQGISNSVEQIFALKIELGDRVSVPHKSFSPGRRQYHSGTILKELRHLRRKGIDRILGVIDVDLYVPRLNFVFGEADVFRGVTVISLTRLRQEFYGLRPDRKLFHERAVKEAIHELGHTYGIGHCPGPECIMHFSNSLEDTDLKGPGFCENCKKYLDV